MSLFDDLVKAKCEIENHQSDLYVKHSKTSKAIIHKWTSDYKMFVSHDNRLWYEIPFAYLPFWNGRVNQ